MLQADLRRAFSRAAIACAGLAFLSAIAACAASDPKIAEVKARRLLIQDEAGGFSLKLSVFALFNGGDAADDFAMMTVTHTGTDVFWEVPASSSFIFSGGGDFFWAGSSCLSPIPSIFAGNAANSAVWGGEGFLPEGSYIVTADNAAGDSATSSFELNEPFYFGAPPAVFRLLGEGDEARWSVALSENIEPSDVSVYLFLLDLDGNPLSSIKLAQARFIDRRAEGMVSDFDNALTSRRNDSPALAAVCCYVERDASSDAVLLFPLYLGQDAE